MRKGTRLLNAIASVTTAALAALVAVLMLIAPATPRSVAVVASTTIEASPSARPIATPIASLIATASDEAVGQRAETVSRSLGVGRGSTSTTQDVAAPTVTPTPATPAPAPTPAPTPTVEDARSFALAQVGAVQFSCLDALWQHESDWDPSAENPSSGAYGIAQALPAAKMASVGHDWKSNPITQVKWGLDYIAGRYGSACNAWTFWLRHYPHWY